jgi:hypothetical protein
MFQTAVLLVVFNRPSLTQRVLERLREIKPAKLFVAADGPRKNKPADEQLVRQTRALIETHVDWNCEVKTLFREENLGCGKAVSEAITWFFEQNETGIILEDDCLPSPGFFSFCEELLKRYKDNERIMHIGGTNFQDGLQRGNASYYFSSIVHVWGWASWRRAWKHYDFNVSGLDQFLAQKKISNYYNDRKAVAYWKGIFTQMKNRGLNTWDHQWTYSVWKQEGLAIIPQKNLVSNIGFGDSATHTGSEDTTYSEMPVYELGEISHPAEIRQDKEADNYTFFKKYFPQVEKKPLARKITGKLKRLFK